MEDDTEVQLTLFAGDSPASPSVSPGSSEAQKMTAHSGLKCYESYERWLPDMSLLRMLLESSEWNSTQCYLTWKIRVTPAKRLLFQLAVSMPRTDEIGSGSLLHTPTAQPCNLWPTPTQNGNYNRKGLSKNSGDGLATAVKMWPTPNARQKGGGEYKDPQKILERMKKGRQKNLGDMVKLWPTPTAMTGGEGVAPSHEVGTHGWNTAAAVHDSISKDPTRMWSTDIRGATSEESQSGSLNPAWVEWLMGYPVGWTDLKD